MKRMALICAAALSTVGLAACADYYGDDYGYGRHYYGAYYGAGYYGGSGYTAGWYDSYGNYHPPRRYRYGY